jgi:hypothetical protein
MKILTRDPQPNATDKETTSNVFECQELPPHSPKTYMNAIDALNALFSGTTPDSCALH